MKSWDRCSRKEKIERWENVLRVLRALTPYQRRKHWDMSHWGVATECGTVACAAGHCGLDPWFRRRGFRMTLGRYGEDGETVLIDITPPGEFFGSMGTADIFYNTDKRPVRRVIKEVREHIRQLKRASFEELEQHL